MCSCMKDRAKNTMSQHPDKPDATQAARDVTDAQLGAGDPMRGIGYTVTREVTSLQLHWLPEGSPPAQLSEP